ncbi:MAG: hypothetical protein ACYS8W_19150 [Planctomycetota bacterium]|jgi:hypothetical protein
MFKKPSVLLSALLALAAILMYIRCDLGVGNYWARNVSTDAPVSENPESGEMLDSDDAEPDKPPMDTSTLKWYFRGVKTGDWVKYWTPHNIEIREVKKISGEMLTLQKRFYSDDGGQPKRKSENAFSLLEYDRSVAEDMKINRENGRVVRIKSDVLGKPLEIDVVASRDVNNHEGMLDAYSFGVPLEGRICSIRHGVLEFLILGYGSAADSAKMTVKPGEHGEMKKALAQPYDVCETGYTNLVMQVNADLRQWDRMESKSENKKPISVPPFKPVPITEAAKKAVDSQPTGIKGLRPGMWLKVLAVKDHIQVWEVTEVTEKSYKFRRLFYNNKAVLYSVDCEAEDDFERFVQEKKQRDDGSYYVKKCEHVMPDSGKKHNAVKYARKGAGSEVTNIFIPELKIGAGLVYSERDGNIHIFVLDFGNESDANRKVVKPGDVTRAKKALIGFNKEAFGGIQEVHVAAWKAERQFYLDRLNDVLKIKGRKLKKCTLDHYLVDIDAPDIGAPPGWKPFGKSAKRAK